MLDYIKEVFVGKNAQGGGLGLGRGKNLGAFIFNFLTCGKRTVFTELPGSDPATDDLKSRDEFAGGTYSYQMAE